MALKERRKFKSYFKQQELATRCGGRREKNVKNDLKVLRLAGSSEGRHNWAESRYNGDDEFSFVCVEFEVLMRHRCAT